MMKIEIRNGKYRVLCLLFLVSFSSKRSLYELGVIEVQSGT